MASLWQAQSRIHSATLVSGVGYCRPFFPKEPTSEFWRSTLHEYLRELLLRFSRDHALAARLAGFFHSQPHFNALAGYREKTKEIAIVGEGAKPLLDVVFGEYRSNQVVAFAEREDASSIPLLEERAAEDGKATGYVCQHFACQILVTDGGALEQQLIG